MIVVVTGGAGFIGSNIVRALLRAGHTVRVLDNFSTGKRENLDDVRRDVEIFEGDIRDIFLIVKVLQGAEVVLHQAALPSVPRSVENPFTTNEVNVVGTLNTLLAARDRDVRRVVVASSSSIYGDTAVDLKVETLTPNPLSPYAITKLTGELYARNFRKLYGLETVALRYFNVFGPRQDPLSQYSAVIPRFIGGIRDGRAPTIFSDGNQSRDFTYVENVVQANLLAASAEKAPGEVINVGCGESFTVNELFHSLCEILGSDLKPNYAPSRLGDVRNSQADIGKARNVLGYEPHIRFKDGLRHTVEWFVSNGPCATGGRSAISR